MEFRRVLFRSAVILRNTPSFRHGPKDQTRNLAVISFAKQSPDSGFVPAARPGMTTNLNVSDCVVTEKYRRLPFREGHRRRHPACPLRNKGLHTGEDVC